MSVAAGDTLLAAEGPIALRWATRFGRDGLPGTARELLHAVLAALHLAELSDGRDEPTALVDSPATYAGLSAPAYAFGVFRAQQGRDATSLVEDVLALRSLTWGYVAALPEQRGQFAQLLLLQERLCRLLDVALRCAVDAFVDESTRVLAAYATRDALTKLRNRAGLMEQMQRAVDQAPVGQGPAVLLIDLDKFKAVNDTLGHLAGDDVLVAVATILETVVAGRGTPARLGGDEFAVVLPAADARAAQRIAAEILQHARKDRILTGRVPAVGLSVGVGWVAETATCSELLAIADAAQYRAKRAGGDRAEASTEADLEQFRAFAVGTPGGASTGQRRWRR